MDARLACKKSADLIRFRVLEVQTLHVRDFGGEKRVQALGLFQEYGVCRECARARLETFRRPGGRLVCSVALFGLLFALGLVLTLAFLTEGGPARLFGIGSLGLGTLGGYSSVRGIRADRAAYGALPEEEALRRAAWACLLRAAPKKSADSDLTYIPVDEKTLAMKNGDLMVQFELLPAVAAKAHRLIHGLPDERPG